MANYYIVNASLSYETTRFRSPYWKAYWADRAYPVKSNSIAFFYELIERINWTPGVEQNNPHLTPGQEKDDLSEAISISHVIANWKPAAAAMPLTTPKVGMGIFFKSIIISAHSWKIFPGSEDAANSLRSWPDEKTGPYAVKTSNWIKINILLFAFGELSERPILTYSWNQP